MNHSSPGYFLPSPSIWPIVGSVALFIMAIGAVFFMNGMPSAPYILGLGSLILIYMLFGWFGTVIRENESGQYNKQVDLSYRWGMSWFIFSEVMFFAAFFGALFYMRVLAIPELASGTTGELLWQGFTDSWPIAGPGLDNKFSPMGAWGIPAINTLLLLTSGATVTWAHWGLKKNNRFQLIWGLILTVALGIAFLGLQVYEYHEAAFALSTGAYGATFYMLTGFHGMHVTLGTIMLIVILFRSIAGHFTPERHFAFEAVSWYWHFVDVVWLGLFVFVYWLI